MAILQAKKVWQKPRPATETRRSSDLTPQEQEHVKKAIKFLIIRHGGIKNLSEKLRICPRTLRGAYSTRGRPSGGLAIRAARLAKVPVEHILDGRFPKPGTCPHCGHYSKTRA